MNRKVTLIRQQVLVRKRKRKNKLISIRKWVSAFSILLLAGVVLGVTSFSNPHYRPGTLGYAIL